MVPAWIAFRAILVLVTVMGKSKHNKKKKFGSESGLFYPAEQDEIFYFIAGYTEGGFPYGITWEEYYRDMRDQLIERSAETGGTMRTLNLTKQQFQEIVDAYDMNFEGWESFLNLETGEVVAVNEYEFDEEEIRELVEQIEENPDLFEPIPTKDSRTGFRDMEDFAETLEEGELRDELLDILSGGRRIFRRFKDALYADKNVQERYYRFVDERNRMRVKEWLDSLDLKVVIES